MFFSLDQIRDSLKRLEPVHPFYGITFLVCKEARLPVGSTIEFAINSENKRFLDQYHKPENSEWYYRVSRTSDKNKPWNRPGYPSSGLQRLNTKEFGDAFIHTKGTDIWGWKESYVDTLRDKLSLNHPPLHGKPIPAFHLAVWLYRERDWHPETRPEDILDTFKEHFSITEEEVFDLSVPEGIDRKRLFQSQKISWEELQAITGRPPDAPPERGGTLSYLKLESVGPAAQMAFEPAERLNLITGDNGFGKTFLLECAWWALTGEWAGIPAYPTPDIEGIEPRITFQISGDVKAENLAIPYDWGTRKWRPPKKRPTIPGLLIYARVDSSFAVWDPAKHYWSATQSSGESDDASRPFVFTKDQIWEGLSSSINGKQSKFINGLIQDWVQWQNSPKKYPFGTLTKVLARLSPPSQSDLGPLIPGQPQRLPYDAREFPTLKHPYGDVPIVYASAGVQRIVTMAYLMVWAWEEHKIHSELIRKKPERRMVVLIDELEAHLHPQWQRRILPALLDVREDLSADLQVQFLIATHSPLVLVSIEPMFNDKTDKIFHLDLVKSDLYGNEVELKEFGFYRHGTVNSWLMSDVIELKYPRSLEGEKAVEEALKLQEQDSPGKGDVQRVHKELEKYLAEDDEFWPRWVFFAEKHGVSL